jgi:hypothetical protein
MIFHGPSQETANDETKIRKNYPWNPSLHPRQDSPAVRLSSSQEKAQPTRPPQPLRLLPTKHSRPGYPANNKPSGHIVGPKKKLGYYAIPESVFRTQDKPTVPRSTALSEVDKSKHKRRIRNSPPEPRL